VLQSIIKQQNVVLSAT